MTKKEKKHYELVIIIRPNLPENVRMGIESKILENLEKEGSVVEKVDNWGRKPLEYPIKGHKEGHYVLYTFDMYPSKINALGSSLKLTKDIIRYLIVVR